jgi:hypothetical protein
MEAHSGRIEEPAMSLQHRLLRFLGFGIVILVFPWGQLHAAETLIPNYWNMSDLPWTRGCSPTAAAMPLEFWDRTYAGFGRLSQWWEERSSYLDGSGSLNIVPNCLDQLRQSMATTASGSTYSVNIAPGIQNYARNVARYPNFASEDIWGNSENDYAWNSVMSEINAGRPFVWSVDWGADAGHSVCAWGYDDATKEIIVYTAWGWGRADWYYRQYNNNDWIGFSHIATVRPSSTDRGNIQIQAPSGGAQYYIGDDCVIKWTHFEKVISNPQITRVDVFISRDGGVNWSLIVNNYSSSPGTNSYRWTVTGPLSEKNMICIRGEDASGVDVDTDGMRAPFSIVPVVPSNDQCSGAMALSNGVANTLDTANATSTGDPTPSCGYGGGKGVWYKVSPVNSGTITVNTCGSSFDTILAVYSGSCGALSQITCDDDGGCGGNTSQANFSGTAGTTYYILAAGYTGPAGTFK